MPPSSFSNFGVSGLLNFNGGILASYVAKCPFKQCLEGYVFCIREKDWCIDTKRDNIKNLYGWFCTKSQNSFMKVTIQKTYTVNFAPKLSILLSLFTCMLGKVGRESRKSK